MNKRDELLSLVHACLADVIILTETWLSAKIDSREVLHGAKNYVLYRYDRGSRSGGGVLIAVSNEFVSFKVNVASELELVCVCIRLHHKDYILCACYRPPNSSSGFSEIFHDVLNKIHIRFPAAVFFVLGDFNLPDISWCLPQPSASSSSSESASFVSVCSDFNLIQLVKYPTRVTTTSSTILDLVLTTHPDLVTSLSVIPGLSDHSAIHFTIPNRNPRRQKTSKTFRDYKRADYAAINRELEIFTEELFQNFDQRSVDENWHRFKSKVSELIDHYVPLRRITNTVQSPWFTPTLKRLRNKKQRLFRKAKCSRSTDRWAAYNESADEYAHALAVAKRSFFEVTLPSMLRTNPRRFWLTINGKSEKKIELMSEDDCMIPSEMCCEALNTVFSSVFVTCTPYCLSPFPACNYLPMDPLIIDWVGVAKLIRNLKPSSPGDDGINPKFLKNTEMLSAIILSKIFSQSLETSAIPQDWKVGKVVPLPKTGNTHNPINYRPISLISAPCKIVEHIIYSHLVRFLENNSFFSKFQHGFRKNYSCETQLLSLTNDLFCAADRSSVIDCVFIDFAKAFDTVCHKLLLSKLNSINLDVNILKWLECFLSNRTQYVVANGFISTHCSVTSGVPQGSVLGPLLFLIYINDLPNTLSSTIRLFADDCVIYREILDSADQSALQSDLNKISTWCDTWLMKLNTNKCKVMRVTRQKHNTTACTYILNHDPLTKVSCYKYLGVYISDNLSWQTHIDHITSDANRMLGFLRRNFALASADIKLVLYKTLVRPKLEYASSIWDPHINSLLHDIEAIQNRSARFILSNYFRTASVSSLKSSLNLLDLSVRRKISRLCLFHKIYHANSTLKDSMLFPPTYHSTRNDHQFKVGVPSSRTNYYFNSFIPKTSSDWNHLPTCIASIINPANFKVAISGHIT